MAGKAAAIESGRSLERAVQALATSLNLQSRRQVRVGRRVWGAVRVIDLVVWKDPFRRLGIECKFQKIQGSTEEKIVATIQDINAWPIDGIVAFGGPGFSGRMKAYLISTGKAVEFSELEAWLRLYFGLPLK